MARVLTVDDDTRILTALSRGLARVGHDVIVARDGQAGLAAAAATHPDVVVLDLRLPDLDGIEFLRRLRRWSSVPVLLLSGVGTLQTRIAALDTGADDFVDKPCAIDELRARIDASLRRARRDGDEADPVVTTGDLRIDLRQNVLVAGGVTVHLTPMQWRLLDALIRRPGRLLTHTEMIAAMWGPDHGHEVRDALRVHVRQLRERLGDDASSPRYIKTESRVGYRWIAGGAD